MIAKTFGRFCHASWALMWSVFFREAMAKVNAATSKSQASINPDF
jgi:hypothetical protein